MGGSSQRAFSWVSGGAAKKQSATGFPHRPSTLGTNRESRRGRFRSVIQDPRNPCRRPPWPVVSRLQDSSRPRLSGHSAFKNALAMESLNSDHTQSASLFQVNSGMILKNFLQTTEKTPNSIAGPLYRGILGSFRSPSSLGWVRFGITISASWVRFGTTIRVSWVRFGGLPD